MTDLSTLESLHGDMDSFQYNKKIYLKQIFNIQRNMFNIELDLLIWRWGEIESEQACRNTCIYTKKNTES